MEHFCVKETPGACKSRRETTAQRGSPLASERDDRALTFGLVVPYDSRMVAVLLVLVLALFAFLVAGVVASGAGSSGARPSSIDLGVSSVAAPGSGFASVRGGAWLRFGLLAGP